MAVVQRQLSQLAAQSEQHQEAVLKMEQANRELQVEIDYLKSRITAPNEECSRSSAGKSFKKTNGAESQSFSGRRRDTEQERTRRREPRAGGSSKNKGKSEFQKRFDALEAIVRLIPGVPSPVQSLVNHRLTDSPFSSAIAAVIIPKKFFVSYLESYNGTGDLDEHVAQYLQRLHATTVDPEVKEACACKAFRATLAGLALR